jgi:hypothetical protein
MSCALRIALISTLGLVPLPALAQQPLPLGGTPVSGRADGDFATYEFEAASAGVLSVAVRGAGDLKLEVLDSDGQLVPDGSSDRDLGDVGTEQLSVILGEPGTYRVRVRVLDGSSSFDIGAAWIAFPAMARPSDPDGRPSRARTVELGRTVEDSLNTEDGDALDWYVLTPERDGVLTVALRPNGDEVDLVLELYVGDFTQAAEQSDQDLQDNSANEIATLNVTAGRPVHIKVLGYGGNVIGRYRLSTSLIQ